MAKSLGLHMNATLAVTETALPLGVLKLGFDPKAQASKETIPRGTER